MAISPRAQKAKKSPATVKILIAAMFHAYLVSMLIIPRDSRTPLLAAAAVSVSGREGNHQNAQMWRAKTAEEPPFLSAANQKFRCGGCFGFCCARGACELSLAQILVSSAFTASRWRQSKYWNARRAPGRQAERRGPRFNEYLARFCEISLKNYIFTSCLFRGSGVLQSLAATKYSRGFILLFFV